MGILCVLPPEGALAAGSAIDPTGAPADPATEGERADTGSSNDDGAFVHPAPDATGAGRESSALPFTLTLGVGYGFRPHEDGRNHGGSAHLYGDLPLAFGFGLRPEILGFAYAPSLEVERPLAHPMAAASLIYAFDDTEAVAVVGVGGFVGMPLDFGRDDELASALPLSGGVLLSLGLRFPVLPGVRVEAGIRLPITLVELPSEPEGAGAALRTQIGLSGGLVLVPEELWTSAFASP